jgi:hypothetical protein
MADDFEERKRLYERTKDELVAGQRSNAEQFDRSVLTLSSGFLALSASFMKDVVPLATMTTAWLLYTSWMAFASAVALTLLGILYGQRVFKRLIEGAEQYYLQGNPEAWRLSETLPRGIDRLNIAVGVVFAAGVFLTVAFVIINVASREMTEKQRTVPRQVERSQPANTFPKLPIPTQTEQSKPSEQSKPPDGTAPGQSAPVSK